MLSVTQQFSVLGVGIGGSRDCTRADSDYN